MRAALLVAALLLSACTDEGAARKALAGAGFADVQITGYRWTGCAESDDFSTGFTAIGPHGDRVQGVVCSGWFKGATIRFD